MKMKPLGRTGLEVSQFCLGTMTWGTQNTVADACDQIAMAEEAGLNFMDTAEMYPTTPISAETQGDTERVIGEWIKQGGARDKWIIATKVTGAGYRNVRDGAPISKETMRAGLEASLKSMNLDYIDLYQLHWPNRGSYCFRQNWTYDPTHQNSAEIADHMAEVLNCADAMIKAGKIRAIGLSNESAWGTAKWLRLSEEMGLPRMASIQNEYALLYRLYDTDLAELSHHEDIGLMAYSPLAAGMLTGKYRNGAMPEGSRFFIQGKVAERNTPRAHEAVELYAAIAEKHGMSLTQMSMAFCLTRPFMMSAIFGATTRAQLEEILSAKDIVLSDDCIRDITKAHRTCPMPF